MLASSPASILNQNLTDLGIPNRFTLNSSRFSRVHIEIDVVDACMRLCVARADAPWSVTQLDVADLRQPETTPVAFRPQTRVAFPAELIGQRFLLSLRMTED